MYRKFLPVLALSVFMLSCSNKYKITQTPDDVYYSPVRGVDEDIHTEKTKTYASSERREIIMSRHDSRWRSLDYDYNYNYDPYHYGYTYGYYYNPYYYPYPVYNYGISPVNPKNSVPRTTNLGSYTFQNVNTSSPKTSGPVQFYVPGRQYNNSNHDSNIRNILTPGGSSSGSNGTRTYSPSGSSGGSGTPMTRPGRG